MSSSSLSFSHSNPVFRVAVALNNMGVDMLEKGAYQQAMHMLMDATTCMRSVFFASGTTPNKNEQLLIQQELEPMMARAHQRCSRPMQHHGGSSSTTSFRMLNLNSNHEHLVAAASTESSSSEQMPSNYYQQQPQQPQRQHQPQEPSNTYYPIRIEDRSPDARAPGSLDDPDVQAAMMLHNFGIANLALAAQMPQNQQRFGRLQQAVYLLQLADEILDQASADLLAASEQQEEQDDCNDDEDDRVDYEFVFRQIACIHMAVLNSLVRALLNLSSAYACATGKNDQEALQLMQHEAEAIQERLFSLRSTVQEMDQQAMQCWGPHYCTTVQTAAAA